MFTHVVICQATPVADVGPFRQRLLQFAKDRHLRGSIWLDPHGIKLSVVGPPENVSLLLAALRSHPGLVNLVAKLDSLHHQPFKRLVVRVTRDSAAWAHEPLEPILNSSDEPGCLACLHTLLKSGRPSVRPIPASEVDESCPRCGQSAAAQLAASIDRREIRILQAVTPLPGRQPFDNFKPIKVPLECDGGTLLAALCHVVRHLPVSTWESECTQGRLLNARQEILAADHVVRAGDHYWHKFPGVREPDVDGRVEILHEDASVIVINKPAPLPMHAGGRFFRNTLQYILNAAYQPERPRPAHRLDANTTGLVVVTRNRLFAGMLQPQFARGRVKKWYLVQVQGAPETDHFQCDAPISTTSGELGSRRVDYPAGRPARTEFRVLQRRPDGTTLLEARPHTGRTHQIRVHLSHLGLPVCGDPLYLAGDRLGHAQTLQLGDPPLCLHAWRIEFVHPLLAETVEFTAPPPTWVGSGVPF